MTEANKKRPSVTSLCSLRLCALLRNKTAFQRVNERASNPWRQIPSFEQVVPGNRLKIFSNENKELRRPIATAEDDLTEKKQPPRLSATMET